MRPPARRTGAPPIRPMPTLRRALLRVLAILALTAGIVAMHSLGLGHGPMDMGQMDMGQMDTGHTEHGVMAETAWVGMEVEATPASATGHAMTTAATIVTDVVTWAGEPLHGMAAMCLAVLPLLVLLVGRLLGWRVNALAHAVVYQGGRGCVRGPRAPPAHLRPSLLKLCILRT